MTWLRTRKDKLERFEIGKLIAGTSGMAIVELGASIALWRASVCIPNLRFSALLFGVLCLGLYFAMIVILVRLRKKLIGLGGGRGAGEAK